ncbi:hypothetical protein BCV70DRAFT_199037 [Testicularia cyperi]|uniref:Uncharacterized protein n=1 Tax=Testicularia cyperi TaxID=1882483 RepID=A0A317XTJ9_9BASI|nr:hypothetical protein BCV70DRAFT_199037 [Testicularia cyperi]
MTHVCILSLATSRILIQASTLCAGFPAHSDYEEDDDEEEGDVDEEDEDDEAVVEGREGEVDDDAEEEAQE